MLSSVKSMMKAGLLTGSLIKRIYVLFSYSKKIMYFTLGCKARGVIFFFLLFFLFLFKNISIQA